MTAITSQVARSAVWITTVRAGAMLGRSRDSVVRLCETGAVTAHREPGRQWRILEASVVAFINSMMPRRRGR